MDDGLTVGADGRFSRVRKLSGIKATLTSAPVELLWFRLPRLAGDPQGTGIVSPRFGKGHILLMIDRADHWHGSRSRRSQPMDGKQHLHRLGRGL